VSPFYSEEYRRWMRNRRCPSCQVRSSYLKYYKPDGTAASALTQNLDVSMPWLREKGWTVACRKCGYRWPLRGDSRMTEGFKVQEIVETMRTEEPIGDELRKIDNSRTSTSSVRRLRVTRRWAQKCDIQIERATTSTTGLTLKAINNLPEFESRLETAIRQNYGISTEEEQTFDEEIELTVPARTIVHVRLHWKRLWQEGYVKLAIRAEQVNVPFRSVLGITFDQETADT
jgi:hypothetical protein